MEDLQASIKYEYLYRLNSLEEGTPEQGEALFQNYYEVEGKQYSFWHRDQQGFEIFPGQDGRW